MNQKKISVTDSNEKNYDFSIKKLPAFQWFELFEKLLKLLDHAESDGDSIKKILHVLAQTGKYTKDDIDLDIENMDKSNLEEVLTTVVGVLKNALLKSSFDSHVEIYRIIMSSMFWEDAPVDFDTFDQFENRFLFYDLIFRVLSEHFDFLQKLQNLQRSRP